MLPNRISSTRARIYFGLFFAVFSELANASLDAQALARHPTWLKLGHYQQSALGKKWVSTVDDPRFFMAEGGKRDPYAELTANIQGLQQAKAGGQDRYHCRFPARALWLQQHLEIAPLDFSDCPELAQWRARINPGSLSLIFPAAYINSPSSMFGHTLLRIDPPSDTNDSELLSWAINYGANANAAEDGGFLYAFKGLTGGYPGTFNLVPYYEKVKEYADLDNRNIFEYSLDFTKAEVDFILLHAWELKEMRFDYYYFDENCAYQLLALLEVARPELELTDRFSLTAIPADTVRAIEEAGLVGDFEIRSAAKTEFSALTAALSPSDARTVKSLVRDFSNAYPLVQTLPAQEQYRLLDLAYRYARLRANEMQQHAEVREASFQNLRAISKLPQQPEQTMDIKVARSEHGHRSQRAAVQGFSWSSGGPQGLQLEYRATYHDWLDPLQGFNPGANIEMLNAVVELTEHSVRLRHLTLAQVESLRLVDQFFTPKSWFAGGGLTRKPLPDDDLDIYIQTGRGYGAAVAGVTLYGLAAARYETHNGLMPGARIGILRNGKLALNTDFAGYYSTVRDRPDYQLQSELRYHLNNQLSLNLSYQWWSDNQKTTEKVSAGVYFFF